MTQHELAIAIPRDHEQHLVVITTREDGESTVYIDGQRFEAGPREIRFVWRQPEDSSESE